jgi:hypothetical protein
MLLSEPSPTATVEISSGKTGAVRNRGWHVVRVVMALILFVAAATKCHEYSTGPILGTGFFSAKWFVICLVEAEWLGSLGLLLLAGVMPTSAWAAALACFGVFTFASLAKGLMGEVSCGCFGRSQLNPFLTALLDLTIVASLLYWRPQGSSGADLRHRLTRVAVASVIWMAVGIPAACAMGRGLTTTLSDLGEIASDGKTVVLTPELWNGKRFPLLPYLEDRSDHSVGKPVKRPLQERLGEGKWLVLLYHSDCDKCQEAIRRLPRITGDLNVQQVALIEVPPYVEDSGTSVLTGTTRLHARLANTREWFVECPIGLLLDEGVTVDVRNRETLLNM